MTRRRRTLLSCNDWNYSGCIGFHHLAVPAGESQLVAQLHCQPTVNALGLADGRVPDAQQLMLKLSSKDAMICGRSNLHALLLHHDVNQLHAAFLLQLTGVTDSTMSQHNKLKAGETKIQAAANRGHNSRSLLAAIRRHLVPAHSTPMRIAQLHDEHKISVLTFAKRR